MPDQNITLTLPELENDLPRNLRFNLSVMPLLGDEELWNIANGKMDEYKENKLESLAELKKKRQLSDAEKSNLNRLMDEAQCVMVRKAEAYRLLARRGYKVFSSKSFPNN